MLTIGKYLERYDIARCGIIPYCVEIGTRNLWFLLARDRLTDELGDFGGGVQKYETCLMAGLREFHEESRGIFSSEYTTVEDMASAIAYVDKHMAIIFIPVSPVYLRTAEQNFINIKPVKKASLEVSELIWISEKYFTDLIYTPPFYADPSRSHVLWEKVQLFLQKNIDSRYKFYSCLKNHAVRYNKTTTHAVRIN